jgi:hypothetical protein
VWPFHKHFDYASWRRDYDKIYREAMQHVGYIAGFFEGKVPTLSDLMILPEAGEMLAAQLEEIRKLVRPRDRKLRKMRSDLKGLIYASMSYSHWLIKSAKEPSKVRTANMNFFAVMAIEHWESLRLFVTTENPKVEG